MLAIESYELSSGFQGKTFLWWCGTLPLKEMVKKGRCTGRTVVEFCTERGLCMGNTYFELVLMKEDMLCICRM